MNLLKKIISIFSVFALLLAFALTWVMLVVKTLCQFVQSCASALLVKSNTLTLSQKLRLSL